MNEQPLISLQVLQRTFLVWIWRIDTELAKQVILDGLNELGFDAEIPPSNGNRLFSPTDPINSVATSREAAFRITLTDQKVDPYQCAEQLQEHVMRNSSIILWFHPNRPRSV